MENALSTFHFDTTDVKDPFANTDSSFGVFPSESTLIDPAIWGGTLPSYEEMRSTDTTTTSAWFNPPPYYSTYAPEASHPTGEFILDPLPGPRQPSAKRISRKRQAKRPPQTKRKKIHVPSIVRQVQPAAETHIAAWNQAAAAAACSTLSIGPADRRVSQGTPPHFWDVVDGVIYSHAGETTHLPDTIIGQTLASGVEPPPVVSCLPSVHPTQSAFVPPLQSEEESNVPTARLLELLGCEGGKVTEETVEAAAPTSLDLVGGAEEGEGSVASEGVDVENVIPLPGSGTTKLVQTRVKNLMYAEIKEELTTDEERQIAKWILIEYSKTLPYNRVMWKTLDRGKKLSLACEATRRKIHEMNKFLSAYVSQVTHTISLLRQFLQNDVKKMIIPADVSGKYVSRWTHGHNGEVLRKLVENDRGVRDIHAELPTCLNASNISSALEHCGLLIKSDGSPAGCQQGSPYFNLVRAGAVDTKTVRVDVEDSGGCEKIVLMAKRWRTSLALPMDLLEEEQNQLILPRVCVYAFCSSTIQLLLFYRPARPNKKRNVTAGFSKLGAKDPLTTPGVTSPFWPPPSSPNTDVISTTSSTYNITPPLPLSIYLPLDSSRYIHLRLAASSHQQPTVEMDETEQRIDLLLPPPLTTDTTKEGANGGRLIQLWWEEICTPQPPLQTNG